MLGLGPILGISIQHVVNIFIFGFGLFVSEDLIIIIIIIIIITTTITTTVITIITTIIIIIIIIIISNCGGDGK